MFDIFYYIYTILTKYNKDKWNIVLLRLQIDP